MWWKDCENRSLYPEIFDEIRRTTTSTRNAISISQYSAETTGLIFTKILHDIVALVALFNVAHTWRYPIAYRFWMTAISARGRQFCPIFAQNRLPWQLPLRYRKKRSRSIIYTQKAFIRRKDCENRPADLEIICLREIIKKEGNYALPATLPGGLKNPRWWTTTILKIEKSQYLQNRLADSDEICTAMHIGHFNPSGDQKILKFKKSNIEDGRRL